MFNSSFNIVIYYNFSFSFRKIFQKEFCIKKYKFFKKSVLIDGGVNEKKNLYKNIGDSLTGNKISLGNGTATTTISASTSENDAANSCETKKSSLTALTSKKEIQTVRLNKFNKVAYGVLFESSNNHSSYCNSPKKGCIKTSDVSSLNMQQNSDEYNLLIEENLMLKKNSYKISKNIIDFPFSSLCDLSEKSFDTDSILNKLLNAVESPHSIIKFKDYNDEDIEKYMDSCSEIIHLSPHNVIQSEKCLNNCTNCYNKDNTTLATTNNSTTKHSKIQSIYVSNYIT